MLRKKVLGILIVVTFLLTACGNDSVDKTLVSSDESRNSKSVTGFSSPEMNEETTEKEKTTEGTTSTVESNTEAESNTEVESNTEAESNTKAESAEVETEVTTEVATTEAALETDGLNSNTEKVTGDNTMIPIEIQIGDKSFLANLYKNSTTDKFVEQLPLTLDMSELNGNEKYNYLSTNLQTNTESIGSIRAGDLMLFGSDCLVLFYEDFSTSYSYTKMGYLQDATELAETLGQGNVQVSFMIRE